MSMMLILSVDVTTLVPWLVGGACLLFYWNWSFVTYRLMLIAIWHCATFQAYVTTVLAYDAIGTLLHFSRRRWFSVGSRELVLGVVTQLWPTSLCVSVLALYAGSVLDHWALSVIGHAVLAAWLTALGVWLRSSRSTYTSSTTWERLQLVVCYALATAVLALKWAFLATTDPAVDASVAAALRPVHVTVWYMVMISTLALLFEALIGAVTAALRVVIRGPVRLPFVTWLSYLVLGDCTVLDPHSDEFALVANRLHTLLVLAAAWVYAPARLPVVFQAVLLVCLYAARRASQALAAYQNVLTPFPVVGPDAAPPPALAGAGRQGQHGHHVHATAPAADDICAICREPLYPAEAARRATNPVRQLPCGHCLHGSCLRPWIVQHPDCPLCRHPTSAPTGGLFRSAAINLYSVTAAHTPRRRRPPPAPAPRPRPRAVHATPAPHTLPVPPTPPSSTSASLRTPSLSSSSSTPSQPRPATTVVLPPLPSGADPSHGFGGGSVQPLVPRLPMRPPPPTTTVTHPASHSPSHERPGAATATSSTASARSAASMAEIGRVEDALRKARSKRQRVLSSLSEHTQMAPARPLAGMDGDQLFDDDPALMGEPRDPRLRRRE